MNIRLTHLHEDLEASIEALGADPSPVEASRRIVDAALDDGRAHYGINTGFGALKNKRIADDRLGALQRNLLLSHACGVGEPVPPDIAALMLKLKIHALGIGYSGISMPTFEQLTALDRENLIPVVPTRGSVGASGDLAPLAHLSLPLIGRGEVWGDDGPQPAGNALKRAGLEPVTLQPKDGLALINGTQLMAGYGSWVLHRALTLVKNADLIAAMSLEALQGSAVPFDARIQTIRPQAGQTRVAGNIRQLLEASEILDSHRDCGKVQDPYSLRCIPQVHGASRDALAYAAGAVETEINAVTDNPLVFENGDILSGGNFHGQPVALALDHAAVALAELASISERRTYLLLSGHDGLPTLLMQDTGANSGFMIPQYTAAALVSENKGLCHPASVDSIPTSLGQEDHVSMGSVGALKLKQVFDNVERVLAIELLTAAQALDYRQPLKPGRGVLRAHERLRGSVGHAEADYEVGDDLGRCRRMLADGSLLEATGEELA